jgi:hypothetical protein
MNIKILSELVIYGNLHDGQSVFCFWSFSDNENTRLIRKRSLQHSQSAELAICNCVTVPCCHSKISRTLDNLFALDLAFKDILDVASRGRGCFTCFAKYHIIKSDHCPLDGSGSKTISFSIQQFKVDVLRKASEMIGRFTKRLLQDLCSMFWERLQNYESDY